METDLFPLEPDYTIQESWREGVLREYSASRKDFQRIMAPPQRMFRLIFNGRTTAQHEQILDWYSRFQAEWFRFDHLTYLVEGSAYLPRSFPVTFAGPPSSEFVSNECYNMEVELVEQPGRALPTANYPTFAAGHPYIAKVGVTVGADNIVTYAGYGFRTVAAGVLVTHLDGVSLGAAPVTKTDVPLGLHRVKFVAGAGAGASIEVLI
jgi:murein DD-endopeptidase MepM/ murein hydrolase activator NlpD